MGVWDKINRGGRTDTSPVQSEEWPRPVPPSYPLLKVAQANRRPTASTMFMWEDDGPVTSNYTQIFREPVTWERISALGPESAKGLAFHRICQAIEHTLNYGSRHDSGALRCMGGIQETLGRQFMLGDLLVLRELRPMRYIEYAPRLHDDIAGEWLFEGGLEVHPSAAYAENAMIRYDGHDRDSRRETLVAKDCTGRVIHSWTFEVSGVLLAISRNGGSYAGCGAHVEHLRHRMFLDARKEYAARRIASSEHPFAATWELRASGRVVTFTPQEIADLA